MKQNNMTAVEWLVENLKTAIPQVENYKLLISLSLEIEKQQIIDAYETNCDIDTIQTGEEYYNETYKP